MIRLSCIIYTGPVTLFVLGVRHPMITHQAHRDVKTETGTAENGNFPKSLKD
jgi:hypothetical protein